MDTDLSAFATALSAEHVPASISVNRSFRTVACLAASDIASIVTALLLACAMRYHLVGHPAVPVLGIVLPALALLLCSFMAVGLYPGISLNPVEELRLSTLSISVAFLLLWSGTFFLRDFVFSRLVYILAFALAVLLVPLCRGITRRALCQKPWWGTQVVILGYGDTGKLVLDKLQKNPLLGMKPYAAFDDDPAKIENLNGGMITGPLSHCLEITSKHKISYGIVCMPHLSRQELLDFLDRYGQCFAHVLVIPNLIGMTSLGITAKEMDGIIGLEVKQQLLRPSSKVLKRLLDLTITALLVPFILPLVVFFGLIIKLGDDGPAFYCNERIGFAGKKFKAWKLRSMVMNGDLVLRSHLEKNPLERKEWQATQKLKHDPRLTRVGRFIRRSSIDELPQFWNVLIGEMSAVGPRPVLESQVDLYGPSFRLYKQVRPGVTGLWQVSGRNHLAFAERVVLDKYVIQNWSVWLDIYILSRTIGAVITAHGAY